MSLQTFTCALFVVVVGRRPLIFDRLIFAVTQYRIGISLPYQPRRRQRPGSAYAICNVCIFTHITYLFYLRRVSSPTPTFTHATTTTEPTSRASFTRASFVAVGVPCIHVCSPCLMWPPSISHACGGEPALSGSDKANIY